MDMVARIHLLDDPGIKGPLSVDVPITDLAKVNRDFAFAMSFGGSVRVGDDVYPAHRIRSVEIVPAE